MKEHLTLAGVFAVLSAIMAGGWYLWQSGYIFSSTQDSLYLFLAFLAGMASFFSPCAFALLPGYISYYIGLTSSRAAYTGILAAAGILTFYLAIGLLVYLLGSAVSPYLRYFKPGVGIVFIFLGTMLYYSYTARFPGIPLPAPKGDAAFFLFGAAYAATAVGCTLPVFLALVVYPLFTGELLTGFFAFLSYSLAKAVLMIAVTCLAAYSKEILTRLSVSTVKIKKLSGLVLVLIGIYLLYLGT